MRLLLDTHAVLWFASADERFGAVARRLVRDAENEIFLSAVVVWEIAIKRRIGKLDAGPDARELIEAGGAIGLPVTLAHAAAVEHLPTHHRDPFDRLLVAQAIAEGATLITRDPAFAPYDVPVAW